jgi:DUF4097 and DUF4098 domain-containing protein YvlB
MVKNDGVLRISLGCLLSFLLLAGCCVYVGSCDMQAKYEKVIHLTMPLSPSSSFETQTHNGSITIKGADVTDCNVIATVVGRARTDQEAMDVVEQTQVRFERSGEDLILKIKRPEYMINRSVSVNLDCVVPNRVDLKLGSHNGAVKINNITGRIDSTTHNGRATAKNISGEVKLNTHNGRVECEEISGDTQLRTHNGGVKVHYSGTAEPICDISIVTHNGSIELTTPHNYSARVEASTHNGSINTDLPITVTGKVSKSRLTGTIGDGQGKLHLETHNGSIKLR